MATAKTAAKGKAAGYGGMIKVPAKASNHTAKHSDDSMIKQVSNADIPASIPVEPAVIEPESVAVAVALRRGKARKPEPDPEPRFTQRPLYARLETIDLIREIAFKKRTSAQALYRQGLLLMLQAHGHMKGKTVDDV